MNLRLVIKNPANQVRIGLVALVVASLARVVLTPAHGFRGDWMDGGEGFLFGIAIAAMLVGLRRGGLRGPMRPGS